MVDPPKPPMKKALLISTRHIVGKPGSRFKDLPDLVFVHRDAMSLRNELIDSHGYHPDDVVLMMDKKSHPEDLWPTRRRILTQMELLTHNAAENCHIFFYFSGHCLEEECPERARMRADGRDSDGKPILDYVLHDYLVKPLEGVKGSKLFAVFDCCHSETLLDLQRGERPNSYSREWIVGPGQLFKCLAIVVVDLLKRAKKCREKYHNLPRPPRKASTMWLSPPISNTLEVGELCVICLSACRDRQLAYDDCERGVTFTKCFIDALVSNPNITWDELRDVLKELISDIRAQHEEACKQESLVDSASHELSHEYWMQEPRYNTSSHTDLRRRVSL